MGIFLILIDAVTSSTRGYADVEPGVSFCKRADQVRIMTGD